MKKCLLQVVSIGFVLVFMGTVWANSEDGMHHGMHRGMMHRGPDINRIVEHMARRLELDEIQELAIRNIVDAAKPEAEALRRQALSTREAIHALDVTDANYYADLQRLASENGELVTQITLLHGRVMAEVSAELTDEQRAKLSAGRDEMRKRFKDHRRSRESTDNTTT